MYSAYYFNCTYVSHRWLNVTRDHNGVDYKYYNGISYFFLTPFFFCMGIFFFPFSINCLFIPKLPFDILLLHELITKLWKITNNSKIIVPLIITQSRKMAIYM